MTKPVIITADGSYYMASSGIYQLFDSALDAVMTIQSCYRNDPILSNKATVSIFNEHLANVMQSFLPFRNTKAIPRGNVRRALYRLEKLAPLSKRIATVAKDTNNKDLGIIAENSKQLIHNVKMIKAALALLA